MFEQVFKNIDDVLRIEAACTNMRAWPSLNPAAAVVHRSPQEIMDEIAALDAKSVAVIENIRGLL